MIAIDTQILVHAHRRNSMWHEPAVAAMNALAESGTRWGIPSHVLCEFYSIVTHPRVYGSSPTQATSQIENWLESPTFTLLSEDRETWSLLRDLVVAARVLDGTIHDARIAAVCLRYGVTELWTADRDFLRFPALRTRNPLIDIYPTRAGEPKGPAWVTATRRKHSRAR